MHSLGSRLSAAVAVILVTVLVTAVARSGAEIKYNEEEPDHITTESAYSLGKYTMHLWYTDESLSDYLNYVAVAYNSSNEEYRVVPELVSGREYLEHISEASMTDEDLPDLYITTNDTLVKAHLAGLADPIIPPVGTDLRDVFSKTSLNAVTFHSQMIAYPLFMECSALCYNYTYLRDWAMATLEAENSAVQAEATAVGDGSTQTEAADAGDGSTQTEAADTEDSSVPAFTVGDEEIDAYVEAHLPDSYDRLLEFSDAYDAPEGVDSIFKWAVTDIFYNYFFIGDSISIGGEFGDDTSAIDIYNEDAVSGLRSYQALNQFFSINTDDVSYDGLMDEFIDGKLVMTIATTDAVKRLKNAANEGRLEFEYRFAALPDMSDTIPARSLSVTDAVAVNGYSPRKDAANDFAMYLCSADSRELFDWTGKVSTLKTASFGDDTGFLEVFRQEYERSVPLPKMIETSNYWVNLEMLFASVWNGDDPDKELKELNDQILLQLPGHAPEEEQ